MIFKYLFFYILTLISKDVTSDGINNNGCQTRDYGRGSFVCVCHSAHCDTLAPLPPIKKGTVVSVTSDKDTKRWHVEESFLRRNQNLKEPFGAGIVKISIERSQTYQSIHGFGGAFTDATGFNVYDLNQHLRKQLLNGYFDSNGLEYNLGRVPIAGADFSTHPYSYDDLPQGQTDPDLKYFRLMEEDTKLKIPMIHYASELCSKRGTKLSLFGSPWGSPGWMKENGQINGKVKLLKQFYSTWASYFIKFLDAYKENGILFDAVTTQNEPTPGIYTDYNTIAWAPVDQTEWIGRHLGPQMVEAGYESTKILIVDDSRTALDNYTSKIMASDTAASYVGGIAVHWYLDYKIDPSILDRMHQQYPQLPILYSEACTGGDNDVVSLGDWNRAEQYANDIIENLNHWAVGWTDWNMALDTTGGPNWVKNFVDSPVIVNKTSQEFYRQPMFYALAHFSKILPRGSVRIGTTETSATPVASGTSPQYSGGRDTSHASPKIELQYVAFQRPDGTMALIILNKNSFSVTTAVFDDDENFQFDIRAKSITSLVWKS